MALELSLRIGVDGAAEAQNALRGIDQAVQGVERSAAKTTPSLTKVTDAVAGQGRELSKVEQAFTKHTSAMASSAQMSSQLSGATLDTNKALGLLSGGAQGAAAQLLEFVGAGGLSVGMLTAITGAAAAALAGLAALGQVLLNSASYYYTHATGAAALRDEVDRLGDTWNTFKLIVGEGLVADLQGPLISAMRLVEQQILSQAANLRILLELWKRYSPMAPGLQFESAALLGATPPGAPPPSDPRWDGTGGMRRDYADMGAPGLTPSERFIAGFLDPKEQARLDAQHAREAQQRAAAERRRLDEIAHAYGSGPGYRLGLSGQIGENIGRPRAPFDPSGMLDYRLGVSGSLPEAVSVQTMLAGVTRGPSTMDRIFGSLGGDVSKTLQRFLIDRASGGSAIGASVGGSIFGSLMEGGSGKAIGSALSGLFGKAGGAIGSFIPFGGQILGSLIGKLFGGLFGETQGHKDLMAGNKDIDAMKAALGSQFGSATGARTAGSIFGVDIAGAWNSQNLAGAEHFKGLVAELDEKQATFNDSLGGTLEKIRDLGGNTSDALRPYLQSLTDAKVLTSDNLALIAKLSGENTVDFGKMEEAAKRYGISVDSLGQAFKDDKMHKSWQQIIDDLDLLQRGGADMNGVLSGMQDEIQDLVTQSIQFGTTIPSNMKPWIQQLIDSGKLLGATGEKIEDISQLSFGDTMQTSLEKLNDTLKELIETLSVGLPKAAQTGADGVSSAFGGGPGGGGGGGGTPVHVHVSIDGRETAEAIVPYIPGVLETRGV